jgi:hypothetical protein
MTPVIAQAIAAEKIKDLHALAAAGPRAPQSRRHGVRPSLRRHILPGLRAMPGRGGAPLASAVGQP